MAKAKKLPSGNWRVRATYTDEDGVKHSISITEKTEKLANAKAAAWQLQIVHDTANDKRMTLKKASSEYIETCRCAGLSPATIRGYQVCIKNFGTLKDKDIGRITVRDIQMYINARSKTAAPKTIRNEVGLIATILRQNGIKIDINDLRMPKLRRTEMEIPDDNAISALFGVVRRDEPLYLAVLFSAIMGLRRGEICALTWGDIDWQNASLTIDKAVVCDEDGIVCTKAPKTESGNRTLAIPASLAATLKPLRGLPNARIVPLKPNTLSARFNRIREEAGVTCRLHDLRHYHASVMIREGVPEKYIVADMGHSSFDMVRRVYGHVMEEKKQEINSAMALHAEKILSVAKR